MPRILIVGAGAIGCTLAWHLVGTDADVSLLARGERLQALREHGLTLWKDDKEIGNRRVPVLASHDVQGPWDAIFICVKQYDLPQILTDLKPVIGPRTTVVPLVNGVPWWLLQSHPKLKNVPMDIWGGAYARAPSVPLASVMGGVVYIPAQMRNLHTVEQGSRNALALGELDGGTSARLEQLTAIVSASGLQCEANSHIQAAVWNKLLGNATFNPISALANATMHQMLSDAGLRGLCARAITELMAVGEALGYRETSGVEGRLQQATSAGHARTSMLQDALAARPLEGEALIGIVTTLATRLKIATPTLDGIWALLKNRFPSTPDR